MEWVPTLSLAVVNTALPPLSFTVPSTILPSWKVTEPVGAWRFGSRTLAATVVMKLTTSPWRLGFLELVRLRAAPPQVQENSCAPCPH